MGADVGVVVDAECNGKDPPVPLDWFVPIGVIMEVGN